jgi:hypothetical protein
MRVRWIRRLQRFEPVPRHLLAEGCHSVGVAGFGVVGEVTSHYAR